MESLEDIYMAFGSNFLRASMMFVPSSFVDLLEEDKRPVIKDLVDKVFIIKINSDNYFLDEDNNLCVIHILPKKILLDDNILLLIKYKQEFPNYSFEFILQKYIEQVEMYKYLSEWFSLNADRYIKNISNEIKQGFELQLETFLNHEKELKACFSIENSEIPTPHMESLKEESLKQFGGLIENEEIADLILEAQQPLDKKTKWKEYIQNLKEEITANADIFILEKVFKVKSR